MRKREKKITPSSGPDIKNENSCAHSGAKNLWIIGVLAIALVSIFSIMMQKGNDSDMALRQVGAMQPHSVVNCPFCGYSFYDRNAGSTGISQCPNCRKSISVAHTRGNFSQGRYVPEPQTCLINAQSVAQKQQVAIIAQGNAPPILRNAVRPHDYRGECTNCHTIIGR